LLGVSDIHVGYALGMIVLFIAVAWTYSLHLLRTGKRLRQ
jgi:ABC-2 type transport system permease protein